MGSISKIIDMPKKRGGFKVKPMTPDQSQLLLYVLMKSREDERLNTTVNSVEHLEELLSEPYDEFPEFLLHILQGRIDGMKLPIRFTFGALLCLLALCDRPGSVVLLLVDALEEFAHSNDAIGTYHSVTVDDLTAMYPWGFYDFDNREFHNWLDSNIKRQFDSDGNEKVRKISWAFVYE